MPVTVGQLFTDWDVPPLVTFCLVVAAAVYVRGWVLIRRTRAAQFPDWRLWCFLGGLFSLFVAVASPLDTFGETLLFMHMSQHFVLMSIAPPLIVLGAPVVPMLRGLQRGLVRVVLGPLFRLQWLQRFGRFLVRPRVALIVMGVVYLGWHVPVAYEFALSSEGWHNVEHSCFFLASVVFWWPVIEPWPFAGRGSRWMIVLYLLLADFVNTGLSAFLCFSGRLLYPSYGVEPRPFVICAVSDQVAAGAIMWVFGSIVFLVPAVVIVVRLLSGVAPVRRPPSPLPHIWA